MPRINWDVLSERNYSTGIDRGVLYIKNRPGVPWNGLVSVNIAPSGGEVTSYYIDGVKYAQHTAPEDFNATLEAFTYPREFEQCLGQQLVYSGLYATEQRKKPFGLSYRTLIGNATQGLDAGYKINIIYNARVEPTDYTSTTTSDDTDVTTFNWTIKARQPADISGYRRTAHFMVDSRNTHPATLANLEDILYGSEANTPRLPTVSELFTLFEENSSFIVIDHGDGTWTATGTEDEVHYIDPDTFEIDALGAVMISSDTYTLTSP